MRLLRVVFTAVVFLSVLTAAAYSVDVSREELLEAHRWVSAKFEGRIEPRPDRGYLIPQLKSGTIEKDQRRGHTLRIANQTFAKGLHAPSGGTIQVHLPAPGKRFTTVVGVDSNDIDYYSSLGRGQVIVTVEVNGKELFRSPVMHEGMKGIPVSVDLAEATDFTLHINNATIKTQWDQVDFADPQIVLRDSRALSLVDLPIGPMRADDSADPPFSFIYGGTNSAELLKTWDLKRSSRELDTERTEYTLIYRDPKTELELRCVAVEYHDFPTIDWTLYFTNTGKTDTPVLEQIEPLDTRLERNGDGEFLLHHNKGTPATPSDYEPYETPLGPGALQQLGGKGGRPTNKDLSYMNLEWPGQGVIVVVGWPGQWSGEFKRDNANGVQVRAGQELTHFKLLPGESVRSPRIVLQFWHGDWTRSQNLWRRWMIAHNMPRPGGKLPPAQMAGNTSREYVEMTEATAKDEMMFVDRYAEEHLHPDYFWMDAGWYLNHGSWENTGTWEVDPTRFPNGLREVSDEAHKHQTRIILWFEPERVTRGSWLYEHHPEWLLQTKEEPGDQLYNKEWRLFNFGNPEAREWMTNHVDTLISEQGIDLYRQDFNMDPLNFWRANDAPDRQGITEIRYVTGYLAYWDALRRRHPNMLLDSCASGGRRNDLETLRRAVPLTRSDYLLEGTEPFSQQMQTYGIASWMPFFGTGVSGMDPYTFRSQMTPGIITSWDLRDRTLNYDNLRKLLSQWRTIAPYYYGDYYPLTPYSLKTDVWAAMQFDRPELGEGFLEVFRRSASPYETARIKLQGLDPEARYTVTNLDTAIRQSFSGKDLLQQGLSITLRQHPDSALLTYKKVSAVTDRSQSRKLHG